MRKYLTEKVGILELFQITFAIIILILGYYAFFNDVDWNTQVEKKGLKLCTEINKRIEKYSPTALLESECVTVLDDPNNESCERKIIAEYTSETEPFRVKFGSTSTQDKKKFILKHMRRSQASEVAFLVLVTCICVFLITHLIVACCANAIEFRTKWNAAIQGVILFSAGFAAMLLAFSTNAIDSKYMKLSQQIKRCGALRYCDHAVSTHYDVTKDTELLINNALHDFHACQSTQVKEAICILLILVIGACTAMILLAMDLTTKYEQESEEEEIQLEETDFGNLVEDHNILFEVNQDVHDEASGTEVEAFSKLAKPMLHGRPSAVILAEYLSHKQTNT